MSRKSTRSRKNCITRACIFTIAASATLSLNGLSVDAAPRTWDNTFTNDDWNDSAHWQGGTAPQNGDDVILSSNDGTDRTVLYGNPPGVTLNSLQIEATGSGVMTLAQHSDLLSVLSLQMGIVGKGAYELSGGTLSTVQSFIGVNGTGTFSQNGGVHTSSGFVSLGDGSLGFGAYTMGGTGSFTANELDIGYSGTGTFGQGGGAVNIGSFVALGTVAGGRGTYVMVGAGALSADNEYIGLLGAGTFVQSAGTNTATTVFSVGENIGAIGTYTIGGTAALSSPEFDIGFEGQGVFFQNGGTVTSPNINLAARNGSTGTYTMTGGSVVATGPVGQPGDIIVAIDNGTNASFTQINGSVTSSGDMSLGYNAGSRGSYTFDGGTITANRIQVAGNPLTAGGFGTFTQNGGVLNASGTVKVWGVNRGVYRFNGGQFTANALDITGGKFIVGAASGRVPRVNSLAIGGNGRFDLNDNKLIIDYTGASPIGAVATPNTITNYIATGRNGGVGGTWSGPGLTSSTANGNLFAVGVAEASQVLGAGGGTFGGQAVDGTAVLVKFTYYGDTDLNGVVDFDDYSHTDQGFNNNSQGWYNGDFDYNGIVDFDDYSLIDFAFNTQTVTLLRAAAYLDGSDRSDRGMNADSLHRVQEHFAMFGDAYANSFLAAVPEPTSLSVLGLAMVGMSRRRRR